MTKRVEALLQSLSDVMFPDGDGKKPVAIDSVGYDGDTPLHVLAWRNDLKGMRALLDAGANPNAQGEMDETPLHVAVTQANEAMTATLLEAGARADLRSEFGDTPGERGMKQGSGIAVLFAQALLAEALALAQLNARKAPKAVRDILATGKVEGRAKRLDAKAAISFRAAKYKTTWHTIIPWQHLAQTTAAERAKAIRETIETNIRLTETNSWPKPPKAKKK